jgi:hypothetical protein
MVSKILHHGIGDVHSEWCGMAFSGVDISSRKSTLSIYTTTIYFCTFVCMEG